MQDGSRIEWNSSKKCPIIAPKEELQNAEKKMIRTCAKEFSVLHENVTTSAKREAAHNYADIFKANGDMLCAQCFKLFSVCVLTKPGEWVRQPLLDVIKFMDFQLKDESNDKLKLVDKLLFSDDNAFQSAYSAAGGSDNISLHLRTISKCNSAGNITNWISDLRDKVASGSSFDQQFADFLLSDDFQCSNWLVSFILKFYFQAEDPTTDQVEAYARDFVIDNPEPKDLILFAILIRNRTLLVENAYLATSNTVFVAHLFDLAGTDTTMSESKNHIFDVHLAILRFCEMIIHDTDISAATGRETGERRWLPVYLEVIGKGIRVLRDACPALRKGLTGKSISEIEKREKEIAPSLTDDCSILDRIRDATEADTKAGDTTWKQTAEVLNAEFRTSVGWLQDEVLQILDEASSQIFEEIEGLLGQVIIAMLKRHVDADGDEEKRRRQQILQIFDGECRITINTCFPSF